MDLAEAHEQLRNVGPTRPAPSLRENALAVRSLTPEVAARAQAYLFASAGVVGLLGVVLPHPASFNEAGMVSIQVASLIGAVMLFLLRRRVPGWLTTAGPFAATMLTSAVIVFSGVSTSGYLLFYLWVAFYAFYFLSRREAALLASFAIVNYVAVVLGFRVWGEPSSGPQGNDDVPAVVLITGTVAVAGAFIVLLRERVGRLIRELTDAASTDPLTGLLNRRGFHRVVETELARSRRTGGTFSLLLGDCDFFKDLNDRLGHHAGDRALVTIARLLEANREQIDVAARIGGEEFALVLPETGQEGAYAVAERIRMRLADVFAAQPVPLTMSFGVVTFPDHGVTDDQLVRAADDALYAAKTLGRDRSVLHSEEIAGILAAGRADQQSHAQAHLVTVLNLAEALDVRDTGTARHSQTVGRYCEHMACELGLSGERTERLRLAGVLHDIGKIGVPDAILRKPTSLTAEEFDQMRQHPEIGARILGGSGLEDIKRWIYAHHERPDGRGYPRGIAADEIPLEAKVLAVADAYEAMTSDRVYRKSIGADAAREQLRSCSGTQFEPRVVDAFLAVLERQIESEPDVETVQPPAGI